MSAVHRTSVLPALATVPVLVLGLGFVFHTSPQPSVFGKYSGGYFAFLAAWWAFVTPAVHLLARWTFATQVLTLPSGRTLALRPSAKLLAGVLLALLLAAGYRDRVDSALGRGVATPGRSDQFHPFLQNVPRPWAPGLDVNRWGFRGADVERAKPPGTHRTFVLGGSTVFCGSLPLGESPAELLRVRLQEAHPDVRIEVQNAGAEWHTTQHSLIKLLTWIQDFDPDLIVVWHAINDLVRSRVPDLFAVGEYRPDYGHFHGPVAALVRPSEVRAGWADMRLATWFSDFRRETVLVEGPRGEGLRGLHGLLVPVATPVPVTDWPSLGAFERNLRDIVLVARAKGIDLVLATQPSLYREDLTEQERRRLWVPAVFTEKGTRPTVTALADGMARFNAVTQRVAAEAVVPCVDLAAGVPKTTEFLWDDVHYTAAGAARVAALLGDALLAEDLVRRRPPARPAGSVR